MRELAQLLLHMKDAGVIEDYAVFGAVAQMRYTEAVVTLDADVLIAIPPSNKLDVLSGIYEYCRSKGFREEGEAVRVGGWPVQFVPVFSPLTQEAVAQAETADFEGIPLRVVRAVHLAVIALSVGRPKDYARILALLASGSTTEEEMSRFAEQHDLSAAWKKFEARFLNE